MSEAQAIETETNIETAAPEVRPEGFTIHDDEPAQAVDASSEVELEVVGETEKPEVEAEPEAVKIEVEEAGKPPARRLSGFEKRLKKKDEKVDEAEARANVLEQENKLLREAQRQSMQPPAATEPVEENFDTDEEYRAARKTFDKQFIADQVAEQTQTFINQQNQNTAQTHHKQQIDDGIKAHYERADNLKIANYDELENNAADALGEDFIKGIIVSTDDSARIIASIGASPVKAAKLAKEYSVNPLKAFANAVRFEINPGLLAPSLKNTPEPEEHVGPGGGILSSRPGLDGVTFS